MLCIHGAQLSWGELMAEGVPVLAASRVTTTLNALPPLLDAVQLEVLATQEHRQLHPSV
jgi:hypothetical protein